MSKSNTFAETPSETFHAKTIIVIHPGSLYLRIGRASDLNPHTVIHAIARRRLSGGKEHKDSFLPPRIELSKDQLLEWEEARLAVSHTLQSCLQSDGRRRYATPPQQISAFNRRSQPQDQNATSGEWMKAEKDIIIGNDILRLNPLDDFNVHFPFKRGDLNIHSGPGGSLTAVLANLETIWSHILEMQLHIRQQDLKFYKAVLIIPDIYNRGYLKELTTLLLCKIGFGSCFLLQDHVAATFGAGLGYACVVDIGDQKTSVSCCEDGMSHANTRVRMEYGGGDITQTFYWLLQKCAFPYRDCDANNKLDALLLTKLKEDVCHVNLDICGSQEKTFVVNQPSKQVMQYTLQVGDECIVAPLSLFTPELFNVTGPKQVLTQKRSSGDPEDPHDENYLRETSRRGIKESMETTSDMIGAGDAINDQSGNPVASNPNDDDIVVDAIDTTVPTGQDKEFVVNPGQLLGLDQAVLQSIDRCPNEDLKRKMYGCILVVGGGMKFQGIGTWLQNRISLQIPYMFRAEQLDIITFPKEMDPMITAWKGAAIMSCLESAQELWIQTAEWEKQGVKILREKAPFNW